MKCVIALCFCGLTIAAMAQSSYSSAKYGISFHYPRGYLLKEGALDNKDPGLSYFGPIPTMYAAPGGIRVVTIETPAGSYPGTDLNNAFFTASIHTNLTNAQCERFPEELALAYRNVPAKEISGTLFHGIQIGEGGAGHQWGGKYYHGYSKGSCYEFGYGLATSGYGAVDGMKKVDEAAVFSILEKILVSVKIHH